MEAPEYRAHVAAMAGDLHTLQQHCLTGEWEKMRHRGCPPLDRTMWHLAAEFGRASIVQWLLQEEKGKKIDHCIRYDDLGYTPLHLAALSGHASIVEILMDAEWPKQISWSKPAYTSPFHLAAENGHLEATKCMIEYFESRGEDLALVLAARDDAGNTALQLAANKGHSELVAEILTKASSDSINATSVDGLTILHLAAQSGSVSAVEITLNSRLVTISNKRSYPESFTALHIAANSGHHEIVCRLLQLDGIKPMDGDIMGRTPLHYAARQGHGSVVEELLLKCQVAEVDAEDVDGVTALHLAACNGHQNVVSLLLSHGADVNKVKKESHNGLKLFHLLYKPQSSYFQRPSLFDSSVWAAGGSSALHFACRKHYIDVARELLKKGVKLDLRDREGLLAHEVAWLGSREKGAELVSCLEEEVRKIRGESFAAQYFKPKEGEGRVQFDHVGLTDSHTWKSPEACSFVEAETQGSLGVFQDLGRERRHLDEGAHWAARRGCVKSLAETKANLNKLDVRGNTALALAFKYGHGDVAYQLLDFREVFNGLIGMQRQAAERTVLHLGEFSCGKDVDMVHALNEYIRGSQCSTVEVWKWSLQKMEWELADRCLSHASSAKRTELRDWCKKSNFSMNVPKGEVEKLPSSLAKFLDLKQFLDERSRELYLQCAAGIMIGAAVFASIAYQGWLQPPVSYISAHGFVDIDAHASLRIFWWSNCLAFYFSILSMAAVAPVAIPRSFVKEALLKDLAFRTSSIFLILSLLATISAFTALGWALSPPHATDLIILKVTSGISIALCLSLMFITTFLCHVRELVERLTKSLRNKGLCLFKTRAGKNISQR